jgi:iron complex outermembrane receptor protein
VEEYRIRGAELTISLTPLEQLSLFGGLTLLDTDPADLPYAPDSTLSTGLNLRFLEHFKLSLDSQYVNEMHVLAQRRAAGASNPEKVGDRFLVNGKLSYMFSLRAGRISGELYLAGENLTDTDYEYRPGYPMPGINGMAGATLAF